MDKINIIIPCAGMSYRTGLKRQKCLLKFKNTNIILRQINILEKNYNCKITVITGFEANKVREILPKDVQEIYNKNFHDTNVAYSIGLALKEISCNKAIIFYGDLIYNNNVVLDYKNNLNTIVVSEEDQDKDKVGLTIINNIITNFSYGLKTKWSHIAKINDECIKHFKSVLDNQYQHKWFSFEVFNKMINDGYNIYPVKINKIKVMEINCLDDLKVANEYFSRKHNI